MLDGVVMDIMTVRVGEVDIIQGSGIGFILMKEAGGSCIGRGNVCIAS